MAQPAEVWVVDDSALDREAARRALGGRYAVTVFEDGSAVLERLAEPGTRPPTVLVLDWTMPGMSGTDVCSFLRARPGTTELGILILTARHEVTDIVEGLRCGANDYVRKPFAPEELVARVDALVRSKRMRERAERAESALRQTLELLPDAVFLAGDQGEITYANEEARRVFASRGELIGRPLSDAVPGLGLRISEIAGDGSPLTLGDATIGEHTYAPVARRISVDDAPATAIAFRDVTHQRRAETRRLDFYSVVAHDLRAPLSAMVLLLQVLGDTFKSTIPERLHSDLGRMRGRARDLLAMVDDFLQFARLESKGFTLTRAPLDLGALAAEALEDFRPLAEHGEVALDIDPGIRPGRVLGDARRLRQVLNNLISNAIKFTPRGGTVRVRIESGEGTVVLAVDDTGRGIAPEILPGLFRRYMRAIDTEHEVSGTGLGLMIVREIVEAHGGSVGVESERGKGSTFWARLPAAPQRP